MKKLKIFILTTFLFFPLTVLSQPKGNYEKFVKYILRNYKLPENLKYNCDWMYAVVKVETDAHNKVVKYKVLNPSNNLGDTFDFIIGYQFSKTNGISRHPIVFCMGVNNLDGCTEKTGDKVFYAPNEPASAIWSYMNGLIKSDPRTIFIPEMLIYSYSKPQP